MPCLRDPGGEIAPRAAHRPQSRPRHDRSLGMPREWWEWWEQWEWWEHIMVTKSETIKRLSW